MGLSVDCRTDRNTYRELGIDYFGKESIISARVVVGADGGFFAHFYRE